MKTETKRSYHHGDLKRKLIEKALDLLDEQQSWQFTLREVARRAEVSHAAPYRHFADKEDLLIELALLGFDKLGAEVSEAAKLGKSTKERFLAVAHSYIMFGKMNPALYKLMFSGEVNHTRVHLTDRALNTLSVVVKILEEGQQEGSIREGNIKGKVAACWSQVHGLTLLAINNLLLTEKVGQNPIEEALATLVEGLAV